MDLRNNDLIRVTVRVRVFFYYSTSKFLEVILISAKYGGGGIIMWECLGWLNLKGHLQNIAGCFHKKPIYHQLLQILINSNNDGRITMWECYFMGVFGVGGVSLLGA